MPPSLLPPSAAPPPVAVPVLVPAAIPLPPIPSPPIPSNFEKNLPMIVKVVGGAVVALGLWIQLTLAPDPDFQAVFPNAGHAIGLIVMVLGGIGNLCSWFVTNYSNNKFQAAIEHKDAVIKVKDAEIENTVATVDVKAAEVETAAKAPAKVPDGENAVQFRLRLAEIEAVQQLDFESAQDILDLMKKRKAGVA